MKQIYSLVDYYGFGGTFGYSKENAKNLNLKTQESKHSYEISNLVIEVFGSGGSFGLDLQDKRHSE